MARTSKRSLLQVPALLFLLIWSAFATPPVLAQSGWDANVTDTRKEAEKEVAKARLEKERSRLEEEKKNLEAIIDRKDELERNVEQLSKEGEELNRRLIEGAARIQASEAAMTKVEKRLKQLSAEEAKGRKELELRQAELAQLLAVLQRMGRNPPPVMITRRNDALGQVRSAMMLATVFPRMREKALALKRTLDERDRILADIREQRQILSKERERLASEQVKLDQDLALKREEIGKSQSAIGGLSKQAAEQARTVADLNELIRKLDMAVAENGALGAYEKKLDEGRAPGQQQTASAAPVPAEAQTAAAPSEKASRSELQPKGAQPSSVEQPSAPTQSQTAALLSPGRIEPAMPFEQMKGRLPLPAQGRRLFGFGDPTKYEPKAKGMALATRASAQIVSPGDGWVVYAGEFRNWGQILIINAGGGYHVLLAGMEQISAQVGQFVLSGEPVGRMGGAQKSTDGQTDTTPILYIEFRKKERPIDPDPWWSAGAEKAQG